MSLKDKSFMSGFSSDDGSSGVMTNVILENDVKEAVKEYYKFLIEEEKETSKHLNDIFDTIIPNNLENIYMIKFKEIFGDFENDD